jgi:hypothetical protein
MNALFNEIVGCRHYLMQKSVFGGYRANVFNFLNTRQTEHQKSEKRLQAVARFVAGQLATDAARLTNFRVYDDEWDDDGDNQDIPKEDVKYINILRLTGPMTRGGGECSYGSLEMRDMLMEAADRDDVVGHIIYCRTPGGMATTLIDFRKAIDYIHSKGQKIYMFCDGTVASGGAFLSAMCDGVFAYNEEDEIGSIGIYTAFFTMENGAVNAITQEKYVEYYAEKSTEKNRPYRDGGDMEVIAKETNEYLDELLAAMKQDRPSIKEEQMNGAMFKMKDVVGSIIDGICTLPELCERIYGEWAATQPASTRTQAEDNNQSNINQQTNPAMSKEYKNLASLAGYEADATMVSDNEGLLTLQPQEADAMEERLQAMTEQSAILTSENSTLKEGNEAMATALANMAVERDAALREARELKEALAKKDDTQIQEIRAEMQAQLDEASARYVALEDAKKNLESNLAEVMTEKNNLEASAKAAAEEANRQLAEKEQIISDLQAQLAEANSGAGHKVDGGESPKTNGQAAGVSQMTSAPAWDSSKSAAENVKAMDDYMKRQKNSVK